MSKVYVNTPSVFKILFHVHKLNNNGEEIHYTCLLQGIPFVCIQLWPQAHPRNHHTLFCMHCSDTVQHGPLKYYYPQQAEHHHLSILIESEHSLYYNYNKKHFIHILTTCGPISTVSINTGAVIPTVIIGAVCMQIAVMFSFKTLIYICIKTME